MKGGFGPLFVLLPHGADDAGCSVHAGLNRLPGGTLEVRYVLAGNLSGLRIDPPRTGELWQHTCFEIFIAPRGMPSYYEFNFSPAGDWAAHAFSRYRQGARLADAALDPQLAVRSSSERLELDARVALDRLHLSGELDIGLSAVIEAADGALSYWALRHPPGKPDFHHADAFALKVDAVRN
jgi:hypothetical protein